MSRRPPPARKRHVGAGENPLRRQPEEAFVDLLVAASVLLGALGADVARGDPRHSDAQVVGPHGDLRRAADGHEGVRKGLVIDRDGGARIAGKMRALTDDPGHVNTICSPSRTNRQGHIGRPVSRAVRTPAARNARASSGRIVRSATPFLPRNHRAARTHATPTQHVATVAEFARQPPLPDGERLASRVSDDHIGRAASAGADVNADSCFAREKRASGTPVSARSPLVQGGRLAAHN
jgi:hypothetical protein